MDQTRNFYNTILKSSHPLLLTIHLAGKIVPIVFYILGGIFAGFTVQFIVIILLVAFDFYITKNISGRKLVQLRWWYDSTDKTDSNFVFESYKQYDPSLAVINPIDNKLFWWSMYLTPVVWFVFGVMCLLRLKLFYLILVIAVTFLTGCNVYGFRLCDRWEPNSSNNNDGSFTTWFQLPNMLDNLSNVGRVQSFFQNFGRGGNNANAAASV
ncbi:golgi apparatus membrane protein Tvp23p [Monosporozyma unispora]|nr:Golgi apparatus membrane protein tvp23 [Kazachstania unispora]